MAKDFVTKTVFSCEDDVATCVGLHEADGWAVRQIVWEPHQPHEPCRIIVVLERRPV